MYYGLLWSLLVFDVGLILSPGCYHHRQNGAKSSTSHRPSQGHCHIKSISHFISIPGIWHSHFFSSPRARHSQLQIEPGYVLPAKPFRIIPRCSSCHFCDRCNNLIRNPGNSAFHLFVSSACCWSSSQVGKCGIVPDVG